MPLGGYRGSCVTSSWSSIRNSSA